MCDLGRIVRDQPLIHCHGLPHATFGGREIAERSPNLRYAPVAVGAIRPRKLRVAVHVGERLVMLLDLLQKPLLTRANFPLFS